MLTSNRFLRNLPNTGAYAAKAGAVVYLRQASLLF